MYTEGWISVTFKKPNDGWRSQDDILLPIYVLSTMSGKTAPDVSHEREILSGQLQVNTCSLLIHTGYSVKRSDQLFEGCRLSKKVDFPRGNKSDFISLAETRSHRRKEGQVKPTSHQLASYTHLSPSLPLFSNKDSEAPKKLQVNSNIAFKWAAGN